MRLMGKTREPSPDGETLWMTEETAKFGLRLMSPSLSTTCMQGLRLLQMKRLPKSSNASPNCPTPETPSNVPVFGLKRKSRPLIESGLALPAHFLRVAITSPPRRPLAT